EGVLVKLDCESVTHAENILVVFPAITNSMFGQQFRIDLVPPRLGVGEHPIEIEDHSTEWWRHIELQPVTHGKPQSNKSRQFSTALPKEGTTTSYIFLNGPGSDTVLDLC